MNMHTKTTLTVIGMLLGVVIGEYSRFASEIAVCVFLLGIAQLVFHLFEKWNNKKIQKVSTVSGAHFLYVSFLTFLFSGGLVLGIIRSQFEVERVSYTCETPCEIIATVTSSPEIKNEYQILTVELLADSDTPTYDIQVKTSLYPKYEIGETLNLVGKITQPHISMPHTDTKNASKAFDYSLYLHTQNIGSEMLYPKIEILDHEAHTIASLLGRLKEDVLRRIESGVAPPASSLASGMLLGATSMSKELTQTFRTAGLSHIVVLSGFNIVIVMSTILFVFSFLPLLLRIFIAGSSVIMFVIMVGASPSVLRAMLMALISLLALTLGRSYVARQALILSLFVIVMYEPQSLVHDVSLHLSFLATAGLVYMSEGIGNFLQSYSFFVHKKFITELFATTLAAYFSTLPYVMFTFGSVSVYALIANILVVPFVPLAMLISFLVIVSSYFSETLFWMLGITDTYLIRFMIYIAELVEKLPFSTISISLTFTSMVLCYILIFLLVKYLSVSQSNETAHTDQNGNLSSIISY
jgi:competence protein ComEC